MGWCDGSAERASWLLANFFDGINAAGWTWSDSAVFVEFDVRSQVVWKINEVAISQMMFQSKLIGSGINLTEVVDARI